MSIGVGGSNIDIILSCCLSSQESVRSGAVLRRLAGSALFSPAVIARGGAGKRTAQ